MYNQRIERTKYRVIYKFMYTFCEKWTGHKVQVVRSVFIGSREVRFISTPGYRRRIFVENGLSRVIRDTYAEIRPRRLRIGPLQFFNPYLLYVMPIHVRVRVRACVCIRVFIVPDRNIPSIQYIPMILPARVVRVNCNFTIYVLYSQSG